MLRDRVEPTGHPADHDEADFGGSGRHDGSDLSAVLGVLPAADDCNGGTAQQLRFATDPQENWWIGNASQCTWEPRIRRCQ